MTVPVWKLTRTPLDRRTFEVLDNQPSSSGYVRLLVERCSTLLTPAVCREEDPIDTVCCPDFPQRPPDWTRSLR